MNNVLLTQLHSDLLEVRKSRDQLVTATLRAVIAAVDNAGAVPVPEGMNTMGVGSTEAIRRDLSEDDVRDLVKREIAELQLAVKEFGDVKDAYVDELNAKITILEKYVAL